MYTLPHTSLTLLAAVLLFSCGDANELDDSSSDRSPTSVEPEPALPSQQPTSNVEGEAADGVTPPNSVRFAGGETSDFGDGAQRACASIWSESTEAEVREVSDQVDQHLQLLTQAHEAPVWWGWCNDKESCGSSTIHLSAELDAFYIVERPANSESAEDLCQDRAGYRALMRIYSEDGLIAGTFFARFEAIREDGLLTLDSRVEPDLRNFVGALRIDADLEEPHFARMDARFALSEEGFSGELRPYIEYVVEEQNSADAPRAEWPTARHFSSGELGSTGNISLTDYDGSDPAPVFEVQAGFRVRGDEGALPAEVVTEVGGITTDHGLVSPGTWLELGEMAQGQVVTLRVNGGTLARDVSARLMVNGCQAASTTCEGECVAETRVSVFPTALSCAAE